MNFLNNNFAAILNQQSNYSSESEETEEGDGSENNETEENDADDMLTLFMIVEEDVSCFCGKRDYGRMIQCDGCDDWCHYPCVGIKRKPKGQWFCPECSIQRKLKQ